MKVLKKILAMLPMLAIGFAAGILVGIVGIVLLLMLIPMFLGLK